MAFPQSLSAFSSMNQVLEAIEDLFAAELERTGSPWVSSHQLRELFLATYGLDLERLIEQRGYGKDLRYFLTSSRRFSIYNYQQPQKYYLAPLKLVVPSVLNSDRPAPKLRH
ncbi:MAG: hypothetical protein KME47_13850 [Nodosilinea sp. WJT8-NPBG4]|jgi:hypothetical protein|nr:hypothetical protein [Nodosilinea sp. WJT8-NPBG4]